MKGQTNANPTSTRVINNVTMSIMEGLPENQLWSLKIKNSDAFKFGFINGSGPITTTSAPASGGVKNKNKTSFGAVVEVYRVSATSTTIKLGIMWAYNGGTSSEYNSMDLSDSDTQTTLFLIGEGGGN